MGLEYKTLLLLGSVGAVAVSFCSATKKTIGQNRPNILLVINDDQSCPYASAYGNHSLNTPGFDFVAQHGALFTNAYVTSPGSSPSRASLLTGRYPWQIEEAGTHASSFPSCYTTYVDVLEGEGYHVGYTGKGWGPGDWKVSGRQRNPAGPVYNQLTCDPPFTGISKIDYASNFAAFLDSKPDGAPFCFWLGPNEPHRAYEKDSWTKAGHSLDEVEVPSYLPDCPEVRGDILDYIVEIEWADSHLVKALEELRSRNMLDNTLIVVMADNGMSFPHAKANCYDAGVHVPLAICWAGHVKPGTVVDANVSSIDLFPTFMEAAGASCAQEIMGTSLLPVMRHPKGKKTGHDLFAGRERHSSSRPGNVGYPVRSIRHGDWLLVHNFHPERWPVGDPQVLNADGTVGEYGGAFHDIDVCPTLRYMVKHRSSPDVEPYFRAGMLKRPEFELFNLREDPGCMHDLSSESSCQALVNEMKSLLDSQLHQTSDSRVGENPEIWESYPRLVGAIRAYPESL